MRRMMMCALMVATSLGCSSEPSNNATPENNDTANNGKADEFGDDVKLCAGVRGNGQKIPAHFAGLARVVEHYGPLHAISGGSSGSITSFLTESMHMNPLIDDCGGEDCTNAQERARLGLLLKSFQGYIEFLGQTDEAVAIQAVLPIVARVQEAGLETVLQEDPEGATAALLNVLEQDDIRELVNPELLGLLRNSPNPEYHAQDIIGAIQGFGSFSADDPKILVRPGPLSFAAVADDLGTAGSFYAGYSDAFPTARFDAWLSNCAEAGAGKTWTEVRALPAGESTCGVEFYTMLGEYRAAFEASGEPSRVDDLVGGYMPALVSTSVITGDGIAAWQSAMDQYFGGEDPTLDVSFDDVRFGYWGDPESLEALDKSERTDLKSQKALGLPQATWREALSLSPAEPGLARALEIDDAHVSAGGWSDLSPVLVLKEIGCDKVVYVTRTDGPANFARGVASLLGMGAAEDAAIFDVEDPNSSLSQSIAEADAVLCTNWNNLSDLDFEGVGADAYNAELVSTDDYFVEGSNAYSNTTADNGKVGCSPL